MILVAGGTGRLGTHIVEAARAQGRAVRVLTRARGASLPPDVEIVTGDVRDKAAVARAVSGCTIVVSAIHGFAGPGRPSPEAIDRDGNRELIRAATEAQVQRFVLVSVQGASPDHPMSLHRAKWAAEQELRASGLEFTVIRPTAFLETWVTIIGAPLAEKGQALVFGPGQNPVNFVSVRDVAALVALSITDPALASETIDIGGPENLPLTSFAERLIAASGKAGRVQRIPLLVLRALSVLARPFSPGFARQAGAAVVMSTSDMTLDQSWRRRFPTVPATRLEEVIAAT